MVTAARAPGADPAGFLVWRPFMARAVVSAIFGLVTIFWREPTTSVLAIAGGSYLLLWGAGYLWTHRTLGRNTRITPLVIVGGGLLLGAGLACLVVVDARTFAFAGSAALAVAGVVELVRGLAERSRPAARDLVLVGVIGLVTGAILPFVEQLGPQALLGVSGGGALLTAVVLGIAALSYRHDSALSASSLQGTQDGPDPVN
ncbi:hypothetical protein FQ377_03300 [Arthrobacter echini]|uniref:DUF308 domain-containing protein n=1 Tax=Arthrobacter echini TaxID=1529066 RepID=A0A5D0XVE9_9MICC|nr:DUF308 domain-containing protein [Arthrobacter echini]TYD00480.1 hypothetical protein FQ377_03300 [Arthrobacter echini]